MVIASSISGLPIYAPSAAFAPTNSAEVSAIASAYQVVSSTATQPYAGTAYVTSVNDAPLSAARAGNAANASLATSAYYDGTGRLISALPDSAAVSAIASSYMESGVSSKQDTLSFAYNTADQISSINGSALGGMDEAAVSGIASAYAESAASSKLDSSASSSFYSIDNPSGFLTAAYTPTFGYNTADQISSIDGSALGGMDEAAVSGIASAYAESAVSSVSGNYYTTANESGFLTAQAQASWSESASASPSYIQDKPDLVDIVAGPGIHIDNPDGNTLRVSMAADYETVLWSGSSTLNSQINLSESLQNFEYIKVVCNKQFSTRFMPQSVYLMAPYTGMNYMSFNYRTYHATDNYPVCDFFCECSCTDTSITPIASVNYWHKLSSTEGGVDNPSNFLPCKVVGINRISGGN